MAALRKTLAHCLPHVAKIRSSPSTSAPAGAAARASQPFLLHRLLSGKDDLPLPLRRVSFFQKRPLFQPALPPGLLVLPAGDRLVERIRGLSPGRLRLDGFLPPPDLAAEGMAVTVEEVRKVVMASRVEAARARLRATGRSCVLRSEFVRVCCEAAGGEEQGMAMARSLDESGVVIILGNVVLLRPEEVAQAIESVIPKSFNHQHDPIVEELRKMEERKVEIDRQAVSQVRRELCCGLGFLIAQTAAFIRLTFWELSWNEMEPICYYVTSIYFMAGYAFFIRTSKDPSYERFFESRFIARQRRLMKAQNFDINRFNELRKACPHEAVLTSPS